MAGTGYDRTNLEALVASLSTDDELSNETVPLDAVFSVLITCESESHQAEVLQIMADYELNAKAVML